MNSGRLEVTTPADFSQIDQREIETSVGKFFEQRAKLYQDQLAVKSGSRQITYNELNQKANQIAHTILEKLPFERVPKRSANDLTNWESQAQPVAVLLGPGIEAMVAIIGLVKAGKLFTVLDPNDSLTRIEFILGHTRAPTLLTTQRHLEKVNTPSFPKSDIIFMDQQDCSPDNHNPDLPISPTDPAVLIYTSGSTKDPKGVVHSHRNLLHDLMLRTNLIKISPSDRLSLLSWGTGQAIKLLFCTLLNGARSYPYDLKTKGITHLKDWFKKEEISIITLSAPVMRSFLEPLSPKETFSNVRVVRTASDSVYPKDIAKFKEHFGDHCFYINALSSSETGIFSAYVMNNYTTFNGQNIPVGFPLQNTSIQLLDESGRQVKAGNSGTIAISSKHISRGYWRRPDLTKKNFSIDPNNLEQVTFRSADLARFKPDGAIELLGRKDFIVKIRGYRVETSEVEAALLEHNNIRGAVVHPYEGGGIEKKLIGYLVPRTRPAPTTSTLYKFLSERLTDYMIPTAYVVLDKIPLFPNGKINRKSLPPPHLSRPKLNNDYIPPKTPIEQRLAEIWSEVIGIGQIGIDDHFMELGGDSLKAGQVMARIFQSFRVDLPIRILFETATIATIATTIEQCQSTIPSEDWQPVIKRIPGRGPWELSFAQKRFWFLNQLNPYSPAFNMPKHIQMSGHLNVTALREAINLIISRHEVLRTNFHSNEGIPEAIVSNITSIEVPLVDLSDYPSNQRKAELMRRSTEAALKPFDLSYEPKLRCILFRLRADYHVLLRITHHIASDGWSRGIMVQELMAHYEALVNGEDSPLAELPIQYSDFARWQREQQETKTIQSQLDYWVEILREIPSRIDLPTDYPRPSTQSSQASSYQFTITRALTLELEELASQEGVTLFMLLLSAFELMLYRYSGQKSFTVGCPIAGRSILETEKMIGCFINMLVIRADLDAALTFKELLSRVREQALNAYANPDVPFEKLVERLQNDRDLSHNPLFQVIFDVHRPQGMNAKKAGVSFRLVDVERKTTGADQAWNIAVSDEGMSVMLEYSADLFKKDSIQRMTRHFETLLRNIVKAPTSLIGDLELLNKEDKYKQIVEWNDTAADYARDRKIHELFEEQASQTPQSIAVQYLDQSISYKELNHLTNTLAERLRARGVGPNVPVGICIERSIDLMVGILSILKANGVYVPLDPKYPKERLAFMLQNSRAILLVSNQKNAQSLELEIPVLCIDAASNEPDNEEKEPKLPSTNEEQLAYIIYTSGSTGRPKGVPVTHRAFINFLSSMHTEPGITSDDRVLSVTTPSFDIAGLEFFLPLTTGACLVIANEEDVVDGFKLLELMMDSNITIMQGTPATWRLLLEANWQGKQDMKILCGGEAMSQELANQLLTRSSAVWNMYGPTETTVYSTLYRLKMDEDGPVSIGRPIQNTQVYLLNEQLQPVPIGVPAEIFIAGDGLAKGYWEEPTLTESKFVSNPFSRNTGGLMYRTGDLARYRPDGYIEFLGRLDYQLKIRGFRIDPSEIENALNKIPKIVQSAVVGYERVAGPTTDAKTGTDKILAAYLLTKQNSPAISDTEIRASLKTTLPDYMIPSIFVFEQDFPLTPTGKLDRNALPNPTLSTSAKSIAKENELTNNEGFLLEIWKEVLHRDDLGIKENFFAIGGHSLNAMQIIYRVRDRQKVQLSVRDIFYFSTIEELASRMDEIMDGGES